MNAGPCLALKTEIELTREKFHRWLVVIPQVKLRLPSNHPDWTNGEVLYRISISPLYVPSILTSNLGSCANGVLPKLVPGTWAEWGNERWTRAAAQNATLLSLAKEYENNCRLVLDILDNFSADDLVKKIRIPQLNSLLTEQVTIEELFHYVEKYFTQHHKDVNLAP